MPDDEFDEWQRQIRIKLLQEVADAYEHARVAYGMKSDRRVAMLQGMAYGMSLYERYTRGVEELFEREPTQMKVG